MGTIREYEKTASIGDVARICDVPEHTIRYWEKEFRRFLQPARTRGGQRRYDRHDIAMVLRIRSLLHRSGFSIKGARMLLTVHGSDTGSADDLGSSAPLFQRQCARILQADNA